MNYYLIFSSLNTEEVSIWISIATMVITMIGWLAAFLIQKYLFLNEQGFQFKKFRISELEKYLMKYSEVIGLFYRFAWKSGDKVLHIPDEAQHSLEYIYPELKKMNSPVELLSGKMTEIFMDQTRMKHIARLLKLENEVEELTFKTLITFNQIKTLDKLGNQVDNDNEVFDSYINQLKETNGILNAILDDVIALEANLK